MTLWRGVPLEMQSQWQVAFATASDGISPQSACPICGNRSLRRFYGKSSPSPVVREGFVGLGACWERCSECKAYVHSSCLVPTWWKPIEIRSEAALTAEPEQLEKHLKEAGESIPSVKGTTCPQARRGAAPNSAPRRACAQAAPYLDR